MNQGATAASFAQEHGIEVRLLLTVLTVRNLFVPLYYREVGCNEICFYY